MILYIFGFLLATVAAAPAEVDHYASRYDHLDIENILNNRRMVNYYAACLLSKGPCPPQGLEFKRILPEALQTNCERCTEKQKTVTYRTIKRLKKEYPKIWDQLVAIWDPNDVYVRKFESSFENYVGQAPSPPILANRFGDESPDSSNADNPPSPSSTITSTITISSTITTITTTKSTNKPTTSSSVLTKPAQAPPFTTVGANLQATVSFGTNLVGGIVRSLGTLGTRVVESGTRLANAVISAVVRP